MLFISQIFRDNLLHPDDEDAKPLYGVVDTDDGVEEVVDWTRIYEACAEHNLEICGVDLNKTRYICEVKSITPYQPPETMTPLQMKTALLSHVHITTYDGWVTSIRWKPSEIEKPVSVRLSDFGAGVSDYCLIFNDYAMDYVVNIVLDDNIDFGNLSFSVGEPFFVSAEGLGVKYDIRELTNDAKAELVYNSVGGTNPLDSIIDRPDRYKRMSEKIKTWG